MTSEKSREYCESDPFELCIRDLLVGWDVSDDFIERMVPMVESIYHSKLSLEKRDTLMSIAFDTVLKKARQESVRSRRQRTVHGRINGARLARPRKSGTED
jgi:hypothetical protein